MITSATDCAFFFLFTEQPAESLWLLNIGAQTWGWGWYWLPHCIFCTKIKTHKHFTHCPRFYRLQPQLRAMFCDSGSDTSKKMRTRNLPGPSLKVKGFCESKTVSIVQESICELGGFWDRFLSSILVSAWINWLRLRFQTIRSRYHW